MGFEVVIVVAAAAWMLSAAYVTLHKRHIGITVFISWLLIKESGGLICLPMSLV